MGRYGETLDFDTGPVIWGEVGVNSQHAFFQLLHQGTRLVPCDFIVPMRSHYPLDRHHEALVANCFCPDRGADARQNRKPRCWASWPGWTATRWTCCCRKAVPRQPAVHHAGAGRHHPAHPGHAAGHVRTQGVCARGDLGINSFDQWGVEYGKQLARQIQPELADASAALAHDASTNALIAHYRARKAQP